MKNSLRRILEVTLWSGLAAVAIAAGSGTGNNWKFHQEFTLANPGFNRIELPLQAIDLAQPDLRDLRLLDPAGEEIPFALIHESATPPQWRPAAEFQVALENGATVITAEAPGTGPVDALELISTSPRFMKAARLKSSINGGEWENISSGRPLFRQDGAELTILPLPAGGQARRFRITLEDTTPQSRIVVTGARFRLAEKPAHPPEAVPVEISQSERGPGESVLTLLLPAAQLELEGLEIETPEELFTRPVRLGVRELKEGEISERIVVQDTIFRIAPPGAERTERVRFHFQLRPPTREIVLHLENGDSHPLQISRITAFHRPVHLAFSAPAAGRYSLRYGNPQAAAPRYDLAELAAQLRAQPFAEATFSAPVRNPDYQQTDPLAGLALEGAELTPADWKTSRRVLVQAGGIQALELDLPALASADRLLRDVRLVRGTKQIPYILERTSIRRSIDLSPAASPHADEKKQTRWEVKLPVAGAPLEQLVFQTSTPFFDRNLHVLESRASADGRKWEVELAIARWRRHLNDEARSSFALPIALPETDTLAIVTDDGDNPPITLERVQATYPVTRLLFRAEAGAEDIRLLTGNSAVIAPHYDLSLVATTLLRSEKQKAELDSATVTSTGKSLKPGTKSVLFWGALGLVVIVLLLVVAKLLPKPEAGGKEP